jgi:hypothetical protein
MAAGEGGFSDGVGGELLVPVLEDARDLAICRDAKVETAGKKGPERRGGLCHVLL